MSQLSILIVEDDEWLGEQYARTLKVLKCNTLMARNALEAMDILNEHTPDCILLDIFLAGPNGIVLLHELRSHEDLAKIPIIICSTSADTLTLDTLRPYGVRALLDKTTMEPDDVVAAVRKAVL